MPIFMIIPRIAKGLCNTCGDRCAIQPASKQSTRRYNATVNIDPSPSPLAGRIDAILPQTQCEQCGYHGCRPYAEAIARGVAPINQCPPGGYCRYREACGAIAIDQCYRLVHDHGVEKPRTLAHIVEADCIGCTKCIQVCPVDAIVGASKLMHTVIADDCTGCELCVPACPVDCIVLLPMPVCSRSIPPMPMRHANTSNRREARLERHQRLQRDAELAARIRLQWPRMPCNGNPVLEALARAKAKQQDTQIVKFPS
jgi:electron transport complex protein RnfB